ncbi:hypothetical protein ACFLV0_05075 [Chloroflexota bacterium]
MVTREGFKQVVNNAFAGMGFGTEGPMCIYPNHMFLQGSNLTPVKENIDKIIHRLTKWEPKQKKEGVFAPPKVTVIGKDYDEAVASMNAMYLKKMWGDGLPLLPPTEERVNWILTGTDLPRDKVIDKILPRGGICSVEGLAVILAMAGGRPEYLPVLIAAVEALVSSTYEGWQAATGHEFPAVVVNGPIAKQIRLNSGYGCLGPSSVYPAGGSIGRAFRFVLQNIGGAIPGTGTMSIYGPMRYTNSVFAEDEDGIPPGWQPLNAEFGFARGTNTITLFVPHGVADLMTVEAGYSSPREANLSFLDMFATYMAVPDFLYAFGRDDILAGELLLGRNRAKAIVDELGWTKKDVQKYLWEKSKVPWSTIEKTFSAGYIENAVKNAKPYWPLARGESWPITARPENIIIIVAGGAQSGHSCLLMGSMDGISVPPPVNEIKLPAKAKWDALLGQAEKDLGPLPADQEL